MIVHNPLAGGLLTGKHPREEPLEGTRFAISDMYRNRYWNERNHAAVGRYTEIAHRYGVDPVTFAVAWTLAHPAVTSAIVGASRPEQLKATLAAADLTLDPQALADCDAVAAELGYSYGPFVR